MERVAEPLKAWLFDGRLSANFAGHQTLKQNILASLVVEHFYGYGWEFDSLHAFDGSEGPLPVGESLSSYLTSK